MKFGWQLFLGAVALIAVGVLLSIPSPFGDELDLPAAVESNTEPATSEEGQDLGDPVESLAVSDESCIESGIVVGGDVVLGFVGQPQNLNPLFLSQNNRFKPLSQLIFRGLVANTVSGIEPDLASWEISEDGNAVTFSILDNRFWQDGQPVTAEDIRFTYTLLQDPYFETLVPEWPLWSSMTIEVLNPQQVRFLLPEPYAPMLAYADVGILPAHLLQGVNPIDLITHPFEQRPVGNGAFVVQNSFRNDGFLILSPDQAKFPSDPYLDRMIIRFYPSVDAAVAAFEREEIDIMFGDRGSAAAALTDVSGADIFLEPSQRYVQLLFNLDSLNERESELATLEPTLRQALHVGIDRQAIIDQRLDGQGILFDGPYVPSDPIYNESIFSPAVTSTFSATLLLEEGGWLLPGAIAVTETITSSVGATTLGSGEGDLRLKDGALLSLQLLSSDDDWARLIAEGLVSQYRPLGVEIQPVFLPIDQYQAELDAGQFDLALVQIASPADPDLYDLWSQEGIVRGKNWGSWNNRQASEALEAARFIWDFDQRVPYYDAFMTLYRNDLPAITLYQALDYIVVSQSLQGINLSQGLNLHEIGSSFNLWNVRAEGSTTGCDA